MYKQPELVDREPNEDYDEVFVKACHSEQLVSDLNAAGFGADLHKEFGDVAKFQIGGGDPGDEMQDVAIVRISGINDRSAIRQLLREFSP